MKEINFEVVKTEVRNYGALYKKQGEKIVEIWKEAKYTIEGVFERHLIAFSLDCLLERKNLNFVERVFKEENILTLYSTQKSFEASNSDDKSLVSLWVYLSMPHLQETLEKVLTEIAEDRLCMDSTNWVLQNYLENLRDTLGSPKSVFRFSFESYAMDALEGAVKEFDISKLGVTEPDVWKEFCNYDIRVILSTLYENYVYDVAEGLLDSAIDNF